MRCPACGFENMPGLTKCGVCASDLAGKMSPRDVTPPRARDRSLRSRLDWEARRTGLSRLPLPAPSAIKRSALVVASLLPGVGMWLSPRARRWAPHHNIALALLTAWALRMAEQPLRNALLAAAFGLWAWSAAEGFDVLFPPNTKADLPLRRIGLVLIAASALGIICVLGRLAYRSVL